MTFEIEYTYLALGTMLDAVTPEEAAEIIYSLVDIIGWTPYLDDYERWIEEVRSHYPELGWI